MHEPLIISHAIASPSHVPSKSHHFILFRIFRLCQHHRIQIDALPRAVWVSGLVGRHESDEFLGHAANWSRALTLWWRSGLRMGRRDVGSSCQGLCRYQSISTAEKIILQLFVVVVTH